MWWWCVVVVCGGVVVVGIFAAQLAAKLQQKRSLAQALTKRGIPQLSATASYGKKRKPGVDKNRAAKRSVFPSAYSCPTPSFDVSHNPAHHPLPLPIRPSLYHATRRSKGETGDNAESYAASSSSEGCVLCWCGLDFLSATSTLHPRDTVCLGLPFVPCTEDE